MLTKDKKQAGFTLLELMIVVSIMAIIAGMSLMRYGNTLSDSEQRATDAEMEQLRQSVIHYFNDQNSYTNNTLNIQSPADIGFLTEFDYVWDADYHRGWRGPYINRSLTTVIDIANSTKFQFDGTGEPDDEDEDNPLIPVTAKLDPYGQPYLFFNLDPSSSLVPLIVSMGADGQYNTADDVELEI